MYKAIANNACELIRQNRHIEIMRRASNPATSKTMKRVLIWCASSARILLGLSRKSAGNNF